MIKKKNHRKFSFHDIITIYERQIYLLRTRKRIYNSVEDNKAQQDILKTIWISLDPGVAVKVKTKINTFKS